MADTKTKKQVGLPAHLYDKLKIAAQRDDATTTALVVLLVRTHLEKRHPDLINPKKET